MRVVPSRPKLPSPLQGEERLQVESVMQVAEEEDKEPFIVYNLL